MMLHGPFAGKYLFSPEQAAEHLKAAGMEEAVEEEEGLRQARQGEERKLRGVRFAGGILSPAASPSNAHREPDRVSTWMPRALHLGKKTGLWSQFTPLCSMDTWHAHS